MESSQSLDAQTSPEQQSGKSQPFSVTDAISYVNSVKLQFAEQPEVYDKFLDVLKDFRNQRIDEQKVTERISVLLHGYPDLIRGFNVFCPPGHHIDAGDTIADPKPEAPGVVTHDTDSA